MEENLKQKQLFLRENILDKGYSTDNFMDLLHSKKGEEGLDLNNWTMRELSSVVKEFISYENNFGNEDDDNYIRENKPKIETDEEYEQKCLQIYKEQKKKENQEYGSCSMIEKSGLIPNGENVNIKLILPSQNFNKESGEFLIETYPYKYQVGRSFGDFEWMFNYLTKQFNNYVIPQLSNKNYGEKYSEEKAKKRARSLNKFLEQIEVHPILKHIDIVCDFLSINSDEDFSETKKKYLSQLDSEENKKEKISLDDIKSLDGKIKISFNQEKEVYFMNIKDNTKINESILKKINKSYKNLIQIMQSANDKMKEISDLWKLLYDKSLKYYETVYTCESYKILNKMMEEFLASESKRINMININIREYFRYIKNDFHTLNDLANKVEKYKDNYYKAFEKLKEDKEKLYKDQDISSWGLNEDDLKHKNVFLNNKELAFYKMMPEETKNVLNIKNIYGAYLNSLIDEYERIRLSNGKNIKENTIKILKMFGDDFKNINESFENNISYLNNVKDDEITELENKQDKDDDKNLFSNKNINKNNQNNNRNNRQTNEQRDLFRNNNKMMINNKDNNRNNINQQKRNNNQLNFNNNQNQININRSNRGNNPNNNQYNKNNNQFNESYNRIINNQQKRNDNNIFDRNRNNQNQNNNQNRNMQFNRNNNAQNNRNRNNNQYNRFDMDDNNFNQNNNNRNQRQNNYENNINQNNSNNRNQRQNNFENNINQNNMNRNPRKNNYENNNNRDFNRVNNNRDNRVSFNEDDNYDFNVDRNNNINIYEF